MKEGNHLTRRTTEVLWHISMPLQAFLLMVNSQTDRKGERQTDRQWDRREMRGRVERENVSMRVREVRYANRIQ